MKRIVAVPLLLAAMLMLGGADFQHQSKRPNTLPPQEKRPCYGYTIIEFGKGIDCKGDTILLQKVNGGQELASHQPDRF